MNLSQMHQSRPRIRVGGIDALVLFVIAVLVEFAIRVWLPQTSPIGNGECLNAARSLAANGTLANPFAAGATGPTAHVSPVFPAIAAALKFLPVAWETSLLCFGLICCGLNAAILPYASELLFGKRKPGIFAGLLSSVCFPLLPEWEVGLSSLLFILACCALVSRRQYAWPICGLAVLTSPACLVPLFCCAIARGRKQVIAVAAGVILFCSPWIARNWIVLGSPSPVRDNFGLELAASNNDCAGVSLYENMYSGCFASHPSWSKAAVARIRSIGEERYNSIREQEALAWIRSHRTKFLILTEKRIFSYLFPPLRDGLWSIAVWLITPVALLSCLLRRYPAVRFLQVAAVASWAPYAFIQSDLRYRALGLWIWLLLAGLVAVKVDETFRVSESGVPVDRVTNHVSDEIQACERGVECR